jgi:hypothetical protein
MMGKAGLGLLSRGDNSVWQERRREIEQPGFKGPECF